MQNNLQFQRTWDSEPHSYVEPIARAAKRSSVLFASVLTEIFRFSLKALEAEVFLPLVEIDGSVKPHVLADESRGGITPSLQQISISQRFSFESVHIAFLMS